MYWILWITPSISFSVVEVVLLYLSFLCTTKECIFIVGECWSNTRSNIPEIYGRFGAILPKWGHTKTKGKKSVITLQKQIIPHAGFNLLEVTMKEKHRKSAKLPWHHNINLSFWSFVFSSDHLLVLFSFFFSFLSFCLFVLFSFCAFGFFVF